VVACAATLHRAGRHIGDAADAALALRPLAGGAAATLFAVGLIGSALLAASVLPLATAYSVCEFLGVEAALNDGYAQAKAFYLTFGAVTCRGAVPVLLPGAPLVPILIGTQILNAVLLVPLLFAMIAVGRDRGLMGAFTIGHGAAVAYLFTASAVVLCVGALIGTALLGVG